MKKGYKNCMGIYKEDGICNKCNMKARGYTTTRSIWSGRLGCKGEYCYRNVPRKIYKWINIENKLPKKNKTVLVKSNAYGIQEGKYIETWDITPKQKELDKNGVNIFYLDCLMAKGSRDFSVIQWAELNKRRANGKKKND